MFNRFKISLFKPSLISTYRNDRFYKTFIYFIILVLLLSIPSFTLLFRDSGLSFGDKDIIMKAFNDKDIGYEINDYELVNTDGTGVATVELTTTTKVVFSPNYTGDSGANFTSTRIILTKDSVYFDGGFAPKIVLNYSDYETLENFSFSNLSEDSDELWKTVFLITATELKEHNNINLFQDIVMTLFYSIIDILIFSLIITLFQKFALKNVKAGDYYKLAIYIMTPYVIFNVLGFLYGLGILSYIGIFISVIYAGIVTRRLIKP